MKYAIISDIHANLAAFRAIAEFVRMRGIERTVCLGDLVGYWADAEACIEMVQDRAIACVRGNHDAVAAGVKEPINFSATAKRSILWTRDRLSREHRRALAELPVLRRIEDHFMMVHAALHPCPNEDVRIESAADAARSFEALQRDFARIPVCFFGHTHVPAVYEWHDGGVLMRQAKGTIRLDPSCRYLINPGSVGLSRDGDVRASIALFDDAAWTIEFHRISYARRMAARRAIEAGLVARPSLLRRSAGWLRSRLVAR